MRSVCYTRSGSLLRQLERLLDAMSEADVQCWRRGRPSLEGGDGRFHQGRQGEGQGEALSERERRER